MAKKVKGHRANKPNDSFGVTNDSGLYRGEYRDEVYQETDEEETEELQADPAQEAATQQEVGDSFVPQKQEAANDEGHDYKKRYDDLKRHYDEKIAEFKSEREQLSIQLKNLKERAYEMPRGVTPPKTLEELKEFKERYPDVFEVVETVSTIQAESQLSKLREEMDVIKKREKDLEKQKAYEELLRLHPDFDELKSSNEFINWLDAQPQSLSDGIYKNNTDAKLAARVVDLYKVDTGIGKKKPSTKATKETDAAASVSRPAAKEISTNDKSGRIWKASEIGKMKSWEFEKFEKELDEARAEGRIDYNN